MKFNVASLLKEHTGASREHVLDDDIVIDGEARHVAGRARFDRTPDGILVRVRASGETPAECSRCLKPFMVPVDVTFDEEFVPTIDIDTGAHVDAPEGEEDAYRIDGRHMLDLSEPMRQYWAMALPMAPLCTETCAGICPVCGEDMGTKGHDCAREQVDARWSELAKLKLR
jgi:uncharacterized protein